MIRAQNKLNAIADSLADLMLRVADQYQDQSLHDEIHELKLAVGLEDRETTSRHTDGNGSRPAVRS